jgi:hypothetical protein
MRQGVDAKVVKLICFWQNEPFIIDPVDAIRPVGFQLTMYLLNDEGKGIFGDGVIRIRMVGLERDDAGVIVDRKLLRKWTWDVEEAMPFRSKRTTYLGWGYGLLVTWDRSENFTGEVQILPEFVRRDNRTVTGSAKSLKIPG